MKKVKYKKVVVMGTTHILKVADFNEFEKELELYKKNPIKYLKQQKI
jgi:hypothetical protein